MVLWSRYLLSKRGEMLLLSHLSIKETVSINKGIALSPMPSFIEMHEHEFRAKRASCCINNTLLEQKGTLSVDVFGYLLGDLQCFVY